MSGNMHVVELSAVDKERLDAYKGAVVRARWFLLVSILVACLLVIHTYLEQLSFSNSQSIEVLKGRYLLALKHDLEIPEEITHNYKFEKSDVEAFLEKKAATFHSDVFAMGSDMGLEQIVREYLQTVRAADKTSGRLDQLGDLDTFVGISLARIRTNNGFSVTGMQMRQLPLLGIHVPANDYVPIMSGMLIVFVVGTWLNVRSLSSILRKDPARYGLLLELLMLNFTFTGLGNTSRDRRAARAIQEMAFWLPFLLLLVSVLLDLRPVLKLLTDGNAGTFSSVAGGMNQILFRVFFLLVALGITLGTTVSSLSKATAIDRHLQKGLSEDWSIEPIVPDEPKPTSRDSLTD